MKKRCSKCKKTKDVKHFGKSKRNSTGYQAWCKLCQTENTMRVYKENPAPFMKRNKKRVEKCMQYIVDYLQKHPCVDCGESNIIVLEFDHLPQYEKTTEVTKLAHWGIKKVIKEIKKCEVVCANCHKIRTATRGKWKYKVTAG